ncbi:hypothetical protein EVAR_41549_1 [Eumeta japonica]|uniref:Uncharacterized protein n=1 Tax=Eumeta variegata TaxID=151549 RepID=A0A4C1X683_EUMVA|nr:hypothetical protein EVAR_41549_1 [Eumeta japonica]
MMLRFAGGDSNAVCDIVAEQLTCRYYAAARHAAGLSAAPALTAGRPFIKLQLGVTYESVTLGNVVDPPTERPADCLLHRSATRALEISA